MADEPGPVRELADGPDVILERFRVAPMDATSYLFTGRSPPGNLLRHLRAGQRRGEMAAR